MDSPKSKRCSTCDTNWPNLANYSLCPRGHGPTFVAGDETPLSLPEADRIRKAWMKFAEYVTERDAEISMLEAMMNSE